MDWQALQEHFFKGWCGVLSGSHTLLTSSLEALRSISAMECVSGDSFSTLLTSVGGVSVLVQLLESFDDPAVSKHIMFILGNVVTTHEGATAVVMSGLCDALPHVITTNSATKSEADMEVLGLSISLCGSLAEDSFVAAAALSQAGVLEALTTATRALCLMCPPSTLSRGSLWALQSFFRYCRPTTYGALLPVLDVAFEVLSARSMLHSLRLAALDLLCAIATCTSSNTRASSSIMLENDVGDYEQWSALGSPERIVLLAEAMLDRQLLPPALTVLTAISAHFVSTNEPTSTNGGGGLVWSFLSPCVLRCLREALVYDDRLSVSRDVLVLWLRMTTAAPDAALSLIDNDFIGESLWALSESSRAQRPNAAAVVAEAFAIARSLLATIPNEAAAYLCARGFCSFLTSAVRNGQHHPQSRVVRAVMHLRRVLVVLERAGEREPHSCADVMGVSVANPYVASLAAAALGDGRELGWVLNVPGNGLTVALMGFLDHVAADVASALRSAASFAASVVPTTNADSLCAQGREFS